MRDFQKILNQLRQRNLLKNKMFLLGAGVVFLNFILIVSRYVDYQKILKAQQYTNVFKVKYPLHRAMIIYKEHLEEEKIKISEADSGDLKGSEVSFSMGAETNLIATRRIKPGEKLTKLNTLNRNDKNYISKIVYPKFRAFTLPVPKERIESSAIIPGNRIDIGVAVREKNKTVAESVACNVKVLEITKSGIVVELDSLGETAVTARQKEGAFTFSVLPESENRDNKTTQCRIKEPETQDDGVLIVKGINNAK
jgi:Flp pilus assembly protein CpaB